MLSIRQTHVEPMQCAAEGGDDQRQDQPPAFLSTQQHRETESGQQPGSMSLEQLPHDAVSSSSEPDVTREMIQKIEDLVDDLEWR